MSKLKDKLADLLHEAMPECDFDPKDIKRNYESNKYNEQPFWTACGLKFSSYTRYTTVHFNGRETMLICVKNGIEISGNGVYFDVDARLPSKN